MFVSLEPHVKSLVFTNKVTLVSPTLSVLYMHYFVKRGLKCLHHCPNIRTYHLQSMDQCIS